MSPPAHWCATRCTPKDSAEGITVEAPLPDELALHLSTLPPNGKPPIIKMASPDKPIRVFKSFEEAEAADKEFYRSLTPEQRIEILLQLIAQHGPYPRLERVYRIVELEQS